VIQSPPTKVGGLFRFSLVFYCSAIGFHFSESFG